MPGSIARPDTQEQDMKRQCQMIRAVIPRSTASAVTLAMAAIAVSAATAAPALAAPVRAAVAKTHIHKTRCSPQAFDVYYHKRDGAPACQGYEGTGSVAPGIAKVYKITTGENAGRFGVTEVIAPVSFHPELVFAFRSPGTELVHLTITRT
jgi:uncharacterized membrane protein